MGLKGPPLNEMSQFVSTSPKLGPWGGLSYAVTISVKLTTLRPNGVMIVIWPTQLIVWVGGVKLAEQLIDLAA
jgi:hypothetical protein